MTFASERLGAVALLDEVAAFASNDLLGAAVFEGGSACPEKRLPSSHAAAALRSELLRRYVLEVSE